MQPLIDRACSRIAPTWPLDRFIAVNPFWGSIDAPVSELAATLRSLSGAELLMPRAWYREAYRSGRLGDEHLEAALAADGSEQSVADLKKLLATDEPTPSIWPRVVDLVNDPRAHERPLSWRSFVVHSISQQCAAYFDDGQSSLGPDRSDGLYAMWRRQAPYDRGPSITMGFEEYRKLASNLPLETDALFLQALDELEIPEATVEKYLWGLLLDLNGWASWCAYRRWTARLAGHDDDAIRELLAIRLAWEVLLLRSGGDDLRRRWRLATASFPHAEPDASRVDDWRLQSAVEIAWRNPILRALPEGFRASRPSQVTVQAAFCIDVRSEVFRRAVERVSPSMQTLGFAGFFGLPIEYTPIGASAPQPRLPGLLAPSLRATDEGLSSEVTSKHEARIARASGFHAAKSDAFGAFFAVEALGLGYAFELVRDSLARAPREGSPMRPRLAALDDGPRVDLAAGLLRGMSLTHDFAPLVLFAGHGSRTRNNPHAAGLDCGACGGHTGEVNARAAAALLNEPRVRAGLRERGIDIPDSTWFIAGLHDTTTDDVTLFDLDDVPEPRRGDVAWLQSSLRSASTLARAERAPRMGLDPDAPNLEHAIRRRASDWAEVRPEWGLANNAAFVVAPRERTRHLDFAGRTFLHEYRHEEDEGHRILELIMTAPLVVAHWINLQYYASTTDNLRYGSGNKVLHNVVGGHIGVFEGNGGDLRIGLPLQSLHDGERWMHTPLRLSVFIEAPRDAMDRVIEKHASVRSLVNHGWVHLFQLDAAEEAIYAYRGGGWVKEVGP